MKSLHCTRLLTFVVAPVMVYQLFTSSGGSSTQIVILVFLDRYLSETERVHGGLLLELHSKGLLWSKLLGALWMPLSNIILSNKVNIRFSHMYSFIPFLLCFKLIFYTSSKRPKR
ncbi:hypothetical protein P879_01041 [Paragonimus westermani]|uniref:Uncharacterized protein n=1 Tax=Paragonimus westermani TaxID=34504 RepID=A0A8T0DJG5_9TREM|nr:hypothetical protein P879_01041 [Paragonimus westermani]